MSFPNHVKGRARSLLGRKWGKASAITRRRQCLERGPDWPTIVKRGQDAMRGFVLREGCTYRAEGVIHWLLCRSLHGHRNQVDLLIDGQLWRTSSRRDAEAAVRWQKWPQRLTRKQAA